MMEMSETYGEDTNQILSPLIDKVKENDPDAIIYSKYVDEDAKKQFLSALFGKVKENDPDAIIYSKYIDENNVNNTDTVTYPEYVIVQGGHTAIELFELILIMIIIVVIIVVVIYGVDRFSLKRPCDMVDM